jgi:phytol kinase
MINNTFLNQRVDNLNRKIIHIISSFIIFFFPYFLSLNEIIFLSLLFALIFFFTKIFNFIPIINNVKRVSLGEVFYPLGVMLAAILFLPYDIMAFQFGVLVLGFSDSLANIVGALWGKNYFRLMGGSKSLAGSLAFLITTLILIFIFQGINSLGDIAIYLIIALILSFAEFVLFLGLDNLLLPSLSAYLITLI